MALNEEFAFISGRTIKKRIEFAPELLYQFADMTHDRAPHHVDASAARAMGFEREIAHGLLVLSLTGHVTSEVLELTDSRGVTYGYDRVRFMGPVYGGVPFEVEYRVKELRTDKPIVVGELTVLQDERLCMTAEHLLFLL